VKRVVLADKKPVEVHYVTTEYSTSLKEIISALAEWGANHKKKITNHE
jgi:DNA-binding HxlR family transcriptional regulator